MIEIQFDDRDVLTALQSLERATGNLRPVLVEIREVLTAFTKQRFDTQTGPDGQHWLANSPVTVDRKGRDQPLTGETGKLMDEIYGNLIGHDALEIGSPMEYAAMQQFGGNQSEFPWLWGDIPARPFLGISDEDKDEILSILAHHLSDAFK